MKTDWQQWSDDSLIAFIIAFHDAEKHMRAMARDAQAEYESRHPCYFDTRKIDLLLAEPNANN